MQATRWANELTRAAGMQTGDFAPETLIGLFQAFRPDGVPDIESLEEVSGGSEFVNRLNGVYDAVRDARRPDGLKDAYFIVRDPPMLDAIDAHAWAVSLLSKLRRLSQILSFGSGAALLETQPRVRVLEGKAPKQPRNPAEHAKLWSALQCGFPELVDRLFQPDSLGSHFSESLYFIATDRLLRDYLRWPLIETEDSDLAALDPWTDYFQLWRHGAKIRVFDDDQVDVYLPRRDDGTLVEALPGN